MVTAAVSTSRVQLSFASAEADRRVIAKPTQLLVYRLLFVPLRFSHSFYALYAVSDTKNLTGVDECFHFSICFLIFLVFYDFIEAPRVTKGTRQSKKSRLGFFKI